MVVGRILWRSKRCPPWSGRVTGCNKVDYLPRLLLVYPGGGHIGGYPYTYFPRSFGSFITGPLLQRYAGVIRTSVVSSKLLLSLFTTFAATLMGLTSIHTGIPCPSQVKRSRLVIPRIHLMYIRGIVT